MTAAPGVSGTPNQPRSDAEIRADLERAASPYYCSGGPVADRLAADVPALLAERSDLTAALADADARVSRLREAVAAKDTEIERLTADRDSLARLLDASEWRPRLVELRAERDAARSELAAVRGVVQAAEGHAKIEAARHQPEPGGCTCGFCAWSVEHVVVMSLRAALAVPADQPATCRHGETDVHWIADDDWPRPCPGPTPDERPTDAEILSSLIGGKPDARVDRLVADVAGLAPDERPKDGDDE